MGGMLGRSAEVSGWLSVLLVLGLCGCLSLPEESRSSDRGEQCRRDLARAERLRGLELKREIGIERETPEQLRASLKRELDKAENRAFLSETEVLLKELRVLKRQDDLQALYLSLMSEQVAAYYDPEAKRVAYVEGAGGVATNSEAFPGMERFVYVHEFCHAIEDSHFDLDRLTKASMSDLDSSQALTSFVEGNAVLVGMDSLFAQLPVNTATPLGAAVVGLFGRVDASEAMEKEMADCPPFLGGALVRPYLDGAVFSNRIRREAGWGRVDEFFRTRRPVSTVEILYPERKYLRPFRPVDLALSDGVLEARSGVMTNCLGAMGIALWLAQDEGGAPRDFDFVKGWMGDRLYLVKEGDGRVGATVWLSYWDRPGLARSFARHASRHLSEHMADASWNVSRHGRLVAAVWTAEGRAGQAAWCEARARAALEGARVSGAEQAPNAFLSWSNDLPWPVRVPLYEGYSSGFELIGGHGLDVCCGEGFSRVSVLDGLALRMESNPDRRYYGLLGGLVRRVADDRSEFSFWKVPLLVGYLRRGSGASLERRWQVLWGLLASGDEKSARILFVPVWSNDRGEQKIW